MQFVQSGYGKLSVISDTKQAHMAGNEDKNS
jgi:hypothetical protein